MISNQTVRFYGDRDFFSLLAQESMRLSHSEHAQYCEFQSVELNERDEEPRCRVFIATDLMDFSSYKEVPAEDFDAVFMVIEDADFSKYPTGGPSDE